MRKITFHDFYGQEVEINNGRASGNISLDIKTTMRMTEPDIKPEDDKPVKVGIALTAAQLKMLIGALQDMEDLGA